MRGTFWSEWGIWSHRALSQNEAFGVIMHWVYNENRIGSCLSSTWQANYNPYVSPLYVCVCFVCECCVTLAHTWCLPVLHTGNIFCSQLNYKRPQPWILTLRNLPLPWWLQEIPILTLTPTVVDSQLKKINHYYKPEMTLTGNGHLGAQKAKRTQASLKVDFSRSLEDSCLDNRTTKGSFSGFMSLQSPLPWELHFKIFSTGASLKSCSLKSRWSPSRKQCRKNYS